MRHGSIVGTRVTRVEDQAILTRGGTYTANVVDEALTGAVHVGFVRSPIAHARIRSIDTAAARAADGCLAVYTAADLGLPPIRPAFPMLDARFVRPLLAGDRVRYVGEPVAAVVAESAYDLEDIADLVEVDYQPLPAVVDPRTAATDGTVLFPEVGTNTLCTWGPERWDEALFEGCEVVVSREITNQRLAPAPLETRAAAAAWPAGGRLTMWMPSQGAQSARAALASMLGIDAARVHVLTPDVGGAFGAKEGADPEHAVVAWIAGALGRPARWVETRQENMLAMSHGRAQRQTITIGGTRDGRVQAYRLEILQDCGAYPRIAPFLAELTRRLTPGPYAIERAESRARCVVTTTTPIASYRGAGRPEAAAAIERAIDLYAAEIGMDAAAVRRRNLLPAFAEPRDNGFGVAYDSGDYPAALERALAVAGYQRLRADQKARRERRDRIALGIGVACYVELSGGGAGRPAENATVEVLPDGAVTVLTGTSPHGQGHRTAWAMLVSDELGVPLERITVTYGDTDLIPEGVGTFGSRSLQLGGAAVGQASRELVELARQRAATVLEADPGDLVFDRRRTAMVVQGSPDASVTLAALAARERLSVRSVFTAAGPTIPFGTHVAVVEVDTETGLPRLMRLIAVDDAGRILNPLLAEGQIHGGLAQGAAQALWEEMIYDQDGNPLTASLADYPMPSTMELPMFEVQTMSTPTSYNPLGAKGIGEAGVTGATPAVQNAVIDALAPLGVRHLDLPTTPNRIWHAIRAGRAAAS